MDTDAVKLLLEDMLKIAGFALDTIEVEEKAENEYCFNILSDQDAVHMIGRNGETLRCIQHLAKQMLRQRELMRDGKSVRIDVDSYRKKQEDNVLSMATKIAKQVIETGRPTTLPAMSGFFRRLVHLHVRDNFPGLETSSRGMGISRAVCITAGPEGVEVVTTEEVPSDIYADLEL